MRLESMEVKNLRTFSAVQMSLSDYTCLVGPNGAGKSTMLCALNIFFRESENSPINLTCLEEQDFHHNQTDKPVEVTLTFTDLSKEAQEDFKDYYRGGKLVVTASATYDKESKTATVKHYGQRSAIKAFARFFESFNNTKAGAAEAKQIYGELQKEFPELPKVSTKQGCHDALREYETKRPAECELIPSEDHFYGVSKGANRMEKYLQWVYVPAVKDAVSEELGAKNTALGKLVDRIVQTKVNFKESVKQIRESAQTEYNKILADNQGALADVSKELSDLVAEYSHPDASCKVAWKLDPEKSVKIEEPLAGLLAGEGDFVGGVARFGHGYQRSLLLGLLHLVSGSKSKSGPKLLLGIEEPELFQHPPQARHLADVLQSLSESNAQVIVSTHSPYFIVGKGVESVRLVRKNRSTKTSSINHVTFDGLAKTIASATGEPPKKIEGIRSRLHQELQPQRNEIFFSPIVILVEGLEDVAYFTSHLHLTGSWADFRRLGCHLVPAEGKSHMQYCVAAMQGLQIPHFVVWDSDGDNHNSTQRPKHEKDNTVILKLCGEASPVPFPLTDVLTDKYALWATNIGKTISSELGTKWATVEAEVRAEFGNPGGLEKSTLFITDCMTLAYERGLVSTTLKNVCEQILNFARLSHGISPPLALPTAVSPPPPTVGLHSKAGELASA